jgi:diketogulonate reductase-like aldo/keto reductase
MEELWDLDGGTACAANQVLYNLSRRGIEHDLLPWCREQHVAIMAYSPVEQGRILRNRALQEVGKRHNATAAQVALAWTLRHDGVIAIPKAGNVAHVKENFGALDLRLTAEDFSALDKAFPPPRGRKALEML